MSYGMKVTAIGAAKIASATTLGGAVVLSKVLWGDANGTPYTPTGDETALVNKRHETPIESLLIDIEQPNVIRVEGLITSAPSSFMCHEVGVEDEDGDLILIGNHPQQYIPSHSDETQLNYRPTFMVAVSNTGVVTVNITPETDFLTRAEADELYDPINSGVRRVDEGWAINIGGSQSYPVVNADADVLDARYWKRTETIPLPAHTHPNATQTTHGFMSWPDKVKLDSLEPLAGGTAWLNKITGANAQGAYVDLLNLPNAHSLLVVGFDLGMTPDWDDPGLNSSTYPVVTVQTGNGSTLYTSPSDYTVAYLDPTPAFQVCGPNMPNTPGLGKVRGGTSSIARYQTLNFTVHYLGRANAPTYFTLNSLSAAIGNRPPAVDAATGAGLGGYGRSSAAAENRIRILCPGRTWNAGYFYVYAMGY